MIGVFSDSQGDLDAFDAAYELLRAKGAKRFLFAGGRYADLDAWLHRREERARGATAYSNADFLADVSNFLAAKEQVDRPAAFGGTPESTDEGLAARFIRTPERECEHYASVPKMAVDMVGNALCCVVHDKNDLTKEDLLNAVVFIHGKSPEPKVVQIGPRFFITPGRLTGAAEQTCGLLEVADKNLCYSAFRLDGSTVLDRESLMLGNKSKLTLK